MTEKSAGQSTSAATDITEFISDLDGGVFAELHAEQMAAELATLISDTLGDSMPVLLGDYRTAP